MIFKSRALLIKVRQILGWHEGGIYKRIDENRELLQMLRGEAPALMAQKPWIEGWLESQDAFLCALAESVEPFKEGEIGMPKRGTDVSPTSPFPRAYPNSRTWNISLAIPKF